MKLRDRARFGIALPQVFTEGAVDVGTMRRVAQLADAEGLDSLWTQSQLVGKAKVLEPLTSLSYAAACTSRITLGAAVLVLTEHFPVQLAKQVATLDHLCDGRLIVSLGIGAPGVTAHIGGHDMDRRVRRLNEGLQLMKALWTQESATYTGQIWQLDHVSMQPKPLQIPHPPVWLSGIHENALRRAARGGNGWMGPGASSTKQFSEHVVSIRRYLLEAGGTASEFTIAKRVYVAIGASREQLEPRVRARFAAYGGDPDLALRVAVYGSTDEVAERLNEVIDAGAELVLLNPLFDYEDQVTDLVHLLDT